MKLCVILFCLQLYALSLADSVAFYGGDFDGRNAGLDRGNNTSMIYDNFQLSSPTTITGFFGNFLDSAFPLETTADVEIRSGVSVGNGGTLLYSATIDVTHKATGVVAFGLPEYQFAGSADGPTLSANTTYWLGMAVDGYNGVAYLETTSGGNGVGKPLRDGNTIWNSRTLQLDWVDAGSVFGPGTWDMSLGIRGNAAPEPNCLILWGFGFAALAVARKSVRQDSKRFV